MLPAISTLVVYAGAAALALRLAHRWVLPVSLRAALLLAMAPLLLTGRAILTGGVFAPLDIAYQTEPLRAAAAEHGTALTRDPLLSDIVAQMLPWRQAIRASLAAGRFPLWNPYVLSGSPLLGVAQPAIFHPGTWIGLALPLPEAWNFEISLRLLIALASAYLFFRGMGASQTPAFLGAFAWAFSDFLVFFVGYPVTPSVAPFPLLLLGLSRVARGEGTRAAGLTAAALVLAAVAGHPETLLFSVAGGGVFFLAELVRTPRGGRRRALLLALAAGAVAAALSAVALLPVLEILPQTLQHALRSSPGGWGPRTDTLPESLRRAIRSLVPYAFGVPGHGDVVQRLIGPAGYAGTLLLPFAAAGLAGRAPRRWLFFWLAAAGLALNARLTPVAGPLSRLPLFEMAVNDYFIFLTIFGLAALAVLGAESLQRGEGRTAFFAGAAAAAAGVVAVACVRAEGLSFLLEPRFLRERLAAQLVPLAAAAMFLGLRQRGRRSLAATLAVLTAAFLTQRVYESSAVYPTYPRQAFYPPLPILDPIPRGQPVRMTAVGQMFVPNIAAMYGVEDVRGYDAMTFAPYTETYPLWCRQLPSSYNIVEEAPSPWLSLLGVRYLLVPRRLEPPPGWPVLAEESGSRLMENPNALPRAFAPEHVAWVGDRDRALSVIATIRDFRRDGVVSMPRPEPPAWLPNGPARVSVTGYEAGTMELLVEARAPVVIGTTLTAWKGWKLELDGKAARLLPFDHAFLGFEAPAGRHRARLRYLPDGFVAGATLSGAAAALLMLVRFSSRRRRVPAPAEKSPE